MLVNAAGAWADELAELSGVSPVGLVPKRRTVITFGIPERFDAEMGRWPLCFDVGNSIYFKPDAGVMLASPADETDDVPCDVQPDEYDVAGTFLALKSVLLSSSFRFYTHGRTTPPVCIDRYSQLVLPEAHVKKINHKWAGLRTFSPDREFVLGPDHSNSGFVWAAGQGGYGIQTAPAVGSLVAALTLGREVPGGLVDLGVDIQTFRSQRFAPK